MATQRHSARSTFAYDSLSRSQWVVVAAFIVAAVWYLAWRPSVFNPDAMVFSVIVYAAELFGFVAAMLHLFVTWRLPIHTPVPAPAGLSVDVFVTTLDEPIEVVRRTLLAARGIKYPHQTWLLDDGQRPDMRAMALELGCHYLARTDNTDAKAGNLNHALAHSNAEFIAVFDADHAPAPAFLHETLGYFDDPALAFVQTPQDFYNLDSFQHRRDRGSGVVWNEQSLFFRVIQRGKDYGNSAFYCGSCAVIRRSALDDIGGFATGTVTEDLHTSLRIHKRGYKSLYHPRALAHGIAPGSVAPFLAQRVRWGRGAMQVWRKEGIVFARGLTVTQRLSYLGTALAYFDGWQKLIFYVAPAIVLTTGLMPLFDLDMSFLLRFVPYYLLNFWMFAELGRGHAHILMTEQYNMARFAAFVWATLGLVRRRGRFRTTSKRLEAEAGSQRCVLPQYLVLAANAVAIPVGIVLFFVAGKLPIGALIGNLIWACINACLAISVLSFVVRLGRYQRREYRFRIPVAVRIKQNDGTVALRVLEDLSSVGFRLSGPVLAALPVQTRFRGEIFLPSGVLPFEAEIRAHVRSVDGKRLGAVGCRFVDLDNAQRDRIDMFLYGSNLQWRLNGWRDRAFTPLQSLRALFARRRSVDRGGQHGDWAPAFFHAIDGQHVVLHPDVGFVSVPATPDAPRYLTTLRPLDSRRCLRFNIVTRIGERPLTAHPVAVQHGVSSYGPVHLYQLAPPAEA